MKRLFCVFWLFLGFAQKTQAQEEYGAKGIYPVYDTAGQWLIFDKKPHKGKPSPLGMANRFLVIGSSGSQVFTVARSSGTYGGACRGHRPLKLRAALLKGPRRAVGRPIIGIRVPPSFSLKGSRAVYAPLSSQVGEATYAALLEPIKRSASEDIVAGRFALKAAEDDSAVARAESPRPEAIQVKIDFGTQIGVRGLSRPFVFVEESQVQGNIRRCLRLADGEKLVGPCVEMPRTLMAETPLLQFVAYDPSGGGSPFLLAYTRGEPLWGDERWGFILRSSGPRLFMSEAMDTRCREGF